MRRLRLPAIVLALASSVLACGSAHAQSESDLERHLREVMRIARQRHVDKPDAATLYRGAIDGLLKSLDKYSTYLNKADLDRMRRRMRGRYSGIGVRISLRDGRLTIVTPIAGGPAEKAGILAGDVVVSLDGKSARGMSTRDSSAILIGKAGTPVSITVRTPHVKGSKRTLKLVRAPIVIEPIAASLIERDGLRIAHVRVKAFNRGTGAKLVQALDKLAPLGGVILDVRNNPGGLLIESVRVCAPFVPDGPVVATVGPSGKVLRAYDAKNHRGQASAWLRRSLPLAVLINGGSASASEIVAGCLQDRGRAVLIGQKSFGKGSVQSIIRIDASASVKLTTARYRLPGGRLIDGKGLLPELRVPKRAKKTEADRALELGLDVIRSWRQLRGSPERPPRS